jgi:hypothetical protein
LVSTDAVSTSRAHNESHQRTEELLEHFWLPVVQEQSAHAEESQGANNDAAPKNLGPEATFPLTFGLREVESSRDVLRLEFLEQKRLWRSRDRHHLPKLQLNVPFNLLYFVLVVHESPLPAGGRFRSARQQAKRAAECPGDPRNDHRVGGRRDLVGHDLLPNLDSNHLLDCSLSFG